MELNSTIISSVNQGVEIFEDSIISDSGLEWIPINYEEIQGFALRAFFHRIHPSNKISGNLPIGEEVISKWWGLPIDYRPTDLEEIPAQWNQYERKDYLRRQALVALLELLAESAKDGVKMRVCSAFRGGEKQRTLYLAAIDRDGCAQRYSAPPGHSEHQLGTCVDLVDIAEEHLYKESFNDCPEGQWLEQNAHRFGFRRTYKPTNVDQTGYISEPWHWRFWGKS
ncbi:MAG: D-alanyl-D-alanine carboxypeptidase family protein [Sumerlaeia bacterium]